jgi:hypothetical protein
MAESALNNLISLLSNDLGSWLQWQMVRIVKLTGW